MANKMAKIYTKTGDDGTTGLVNGKRLLKSHLRISLYGDIDELNSAVGVLISHLEEFPFASPKLHLLYNIQENLFNVGSFFACESDYWETFKLPKLEVDLITRIEHEIDLLQSELPPLKNFILPGGSKPSSFAHLCRTIARRVEREIAKFGQENQSEIPENSLIFLNRLSDLFFVFSRWINKSMDKTDIIWKGKK